MDHTSVHVSHCRTLSVEDIKLLLGELPQNNNLRNNVNINIHFD